MIWYCAILGTIFALGMIGEKQHKNKALYAVGFVMCLVCGIILKLI